MRSTTSNTASSTSAESVTPPWSPTPCPSRLAAEPGQQPLLGRGGRGGVQRRVEQAGDAVLGQLLGEDEGRGDELAVEFGVAVGGAGEVPRVHREVGGHLEDVLGRGRRASREV